MRNEQCIGFCSSKAQLLTHNPYKQGQQTETGIRHISPRFCNDLCSASEAGVKIASLFRHVTIHQTIDLILIKTIISHGNPPLMMDIQLLSDSFLPPLPVAASSSIRSTISLLRQSFPPNGSRRILSEHPALYIPGIAQTSSPDTP